MEGLCRFHLDRVGFKGDFAFHTVSVTDSETLEGGNNMRLKPLHVAGQNF